MEADKENLGDPLHFAAERDLEGIPWDELASVVRKRKEARAEELKALVTSHV